MQNAVDVKWASETTAAEGYGPSYFGVRTRSIGMSVPWRTS